MVCRAVESITKIVPIAAFSERASFMSLEIVVPVLMGVALLWWIGQGMSWAIRLTVAAVTLGLAILIVAAERSGWFVAP
jgi:hypothetical protein